MLRYYKAYINIILKINRYYSFYYNFYNLVKVF